MEPDRPCSTTFLRSALLPLDLEEREPAVSATLRAAAVLLLLFPTREGPAFLLTERPTTLTRHAGQISLPGGAWETGDTTLWHTAVREAREELGMKTGRLRGLGRLASVTVAPTGYAVSPFVAWNPVAPILHPDPREVAAVIEVPLQLLFDPAAACEEIWELRGTPWRVSFYRFGERRVWGATARILHDLARRLRPDHVLSSEPGSVRPVVSR